MYQGDDFSARNLGKSLFHFQTDWLGQPVLINGKRPKCLLHYLVMAIIPNPKKLPRKCSLSSETVRYMQEQINQDYF